MIPMSCPSCGRRGNVPLDRLNTRMHCKKCDAVFHLDATGKPVLGEPKAAKGGKSSAAKGRDKNEPLDPIGMIASKLAQVPKGVYLSLLGVGAIYVLYLIYAGSGGPPPDRTMTLRGVAADFAQAYLKKDVNTIKGMATDDSRDEAGKVVEEFRSSLNDSGQADQVFVTVGPPSDDSGQPIVTIDLSPPRPEGSTTAPPTLQLDTQWYEAKGKWYLNGKDTLRLNKERAEREHPKGTAKKK